MKKSVISLSGGMDSATLIAWSKHVLFADVVAAVGFSYGSKHNEYELDCAEKICEHYGIRFLHMDLSEAFVAHESHLLKSGGPIPEGHYEDESMSQTVVPFRNGVFASLLAGIAESKKADYALMGIHSGDHAIYPDCRPAFYHRMFEAVLAGTDGKVRLMAPFLKIDKQKILEIGISHGTPYQMTRTCYKDQPLACGKCGSCTERLEAFARCGIPDPVQYE